MDQFDAYLDSMAGIKQIKVNTIIVEFSELN